ncbi:hypothetical protein RB614_44025 [Phytohabitans sp. ZYX-F-186]|uniref:SMODS and SLOG-associating 2TM effector domain-containing protein n=1 Tax=Phytohabitans maris TaxID=3071409 RepID=A0ABU0ZWR1_9ACTN|nr:hypothetical protein [Phytohabitans sp. ZYX-F-186]MDQ7911476.1 hypothetical protein [Phytohabitans sp. ZYX-F-186]
MADGKQPDLARLVADLDALDAEFVNAYHGRMGGWRLRLGPVHLRGRFGSQGIARIYALFCASCFVTGGVLAVFSATKELGVAVVVGAIFAGGSFVGQWWTVQMGEEMEADREVYGPEEVRRLREMLRRRERLAARIERVEPGYFDEEK